MNVNVSNDGATGTVGVSRVVSTPVLVSPGNTSVVESRPAPRNDVVEIQVSPNTAAPSALSVFESSDIRSGARLHVDHETERVVVEILNANNEVIRQVPPEEVLRIAARFQEISGLIFDLQI